MMTRQRKKETITMQMCVRVPVSLHTKIEDRAKFFDCTMAEFVRDAIKFYLENNCGED
jgi:predicted DNA-binding protein